MLNLKPLLQRLEVTQRALAEYLSLSPAAVAQIVNHGQWPRTANEKALRREVSAFLKSHSATARDIKAAFDQYVAPAQKKRAGLRANVTQPIPSSHESDEKPLAEELPMLLRKQTINRAARAHFKIPRDPFTDEMTCEQDVFITDDIRYVRASMRQTSKHGGLLAVVSQSGGGKSILRRDMHEWINTSGEPITVIEPYVIGMEDTDVKGRSLRSSDITAAVIRAVSPGTKLKASQQDRAAQMHDILKASAQIGHKHVLIIEEAHALATATLKHLKRFYELEDGFKRLLAIILIGQNELGLKLSESNPDVREVVQRCEVVTLPPMDNHIEGYLRHKFARVEVNFDAVMDVKAVDEIRNRLRHSVLETGRGQGPRQSRTLSLCHPLAINNLISRAMNEAVRIGAPKVDAGLIAASARAE